MQRVDLYINPGDASVGASIRRCSLCLYSLVHRDLNNGWSAIITIGDHSHQPANEIVKSLDVLFEHQRGGDFPWTSGTVGDAKHQPIEFLNHLILR